MYYYHYDPLKISMTVAQTIADAVPAGIALGEEALFVKFSLSEEGSTSHFFTSHRFGSITETPGVNEVRIDLRVPKKDPSP